MSTEIPEISIAVPAFNEEANLEKLFTEVDKALAGTCSSYELIIVDDGSSDGSLDLLKSLHEEHPQVHFLSFSRNFGHQAALTAGLVHSRGRAVITMDADLQHPPDMLPTLIKHWKEGFQVVYTIKNQASKITLQRRLFMRMGYFVLQRFCGLKIGFGQSDFRLLDRAVVDEICHMKERDKLLRGLVDWVGFRQTGISYDVPPRFAGTAKYTFGQLLGLVTSGLFSFSVLPLRIFSFFGLGLAGLSFLYGLFAIVNRIVAAVSETPIDSPPGWASIVAAIVLLSGVQLIGIGLLGEYIGRIYEEVKSRPSFIVDETSL